MRKLSAPSVREAYREANYRAARIIAADPEKYGTGMVMWAKLFLERHSIGRAD